MDFSANEARAIGDKIGLDWSKVDLEQFRRGLVVELEHGTKLGQATNVTDDDPLTTGKIAHGHLLEVPDYYTRLEEMEKTAEEYWRNKTE